MDLEFREIVQIMLTHLETRSKQAPLGHNRLHGLLIQRLMVFVPKRRGLDLNRQQRAKLPRHATLFPRAENPLEFETQRRLYQCTMCSAALCKRFSLYTRMQHYTARLFEIEKRTREGAWRYTAVAQV